MKNTKQLTVLQMQFVMTLINNGMDNETALSYVINGDDVKTSNEPIKVVKEQQKPESKSRTNKSKGKPTKEKETQDKKDKQKVLPFGNVKSGDYFANYTIVADKEPIIDRVHKAVKVLVSDNEITTNEKKAGANVSYQLDHCCKISKNTYNSMKKAEREKRKTTQSARDNTTTDSRLSKRDYTILVAYLASKENPDLEHLYKDAQEPNKTDEQLANIRKIVKDKCPNIKLTSKQAVEEFSKLLNA